MPRECVRAKRHGNIITAPDLAPGSSQQPAQGSADNRIEAPLDWDRIPRIYSRLGRCQGALPGLAIFRAAVTRSSGRISAPSHR
ncbi:hypothetical protein NDU88_001014 [Pleurodeles waltl]|uniref:Uncharacterized protein n=1 Tax=Pleurodeles waltl TaxID=8319 RepID=A0AAV7V703_PLEWA|nr:hypothetical protein NDU88_001014 [Pleurodeles waltl]